MQVNLSDPAHVTGQASVVSAATSITMFGMSLSELGVIVSALVAFATFVLHMWYTLRKDARAKEIHYKRLESGDLDGSPE